MKQHLTNFSEDMRVIYVAAVRSFGDTRMVVEAHATMAAPDHYGGSLWVHYTGSEPDWGMVAEFWNNFDKVRLGLRQFGPIALANLSKGLL